MIATTRGGGRNPVRDATGRRRRAPSLPLAVAALPMALFLLVPVAALLLGVRVPSVLAGLAEPQVMQAVTLSLSTTAITAGLAVALGTPLAYLIARHRFRGRGLLDTLIDLPMVLPPAVAGIALLVAFGRRGLVGSWLDPLGIRIGFTQVAVVLAQLFVASPFYIKAAIIGFESVERETEQAARIDGATPRQVFRYVTAPLASGALLGGAVMTWARALGEFGATIIFAGNFPGRTQTMPLAIYLGFELDFRAALTLAAILLAVSFGVLFVVKGFLRQRLGRL